MNPSQILLCVPARLASSRLPEKLLADLGGQTVIEHVCDRLRDIEKGLDRSDLNAVPRELLVLTDSDRIASVVRSKGVNVFKSLKPHGSGSARIREAVVERLTSKRLAEDALILNIQGDEPFLEASDVIRLIQDFNQPHARNCPMGTLVHRNASLEDFLDPSIVKVVRQADGRALYFSRAPIPWPRDVFGVKPFCERQRIDWFVDLPEGWGFWHHQGIYIYRPVYFLSEHETPSGQELLHELEALEQLEVLLAGQSIWVTESTAPSFGIDTLRDLDRARVLLANTSAGQP